MSKGSRRKLHQNLSIKHYTQSFLFKTTKKRNKIHNQLEEGVVFREDEVSIIEEEEEDHIAQKDEEEEGISSNLFREEGDEVEMVSILIKNFRIMIKETWNAIIVMAMDIIATSAIKFRIMIKEMCSAIIVMVMDIIVINVIKRVPVLK